MIESSLAMSVAPFDLGARVDLSSEKWTNRCDLAFREAGWSKVSPSNEMVANLGLCLEYRLGECSIVIPSYGVGVLIVGQSEPEVFTRDRPFSAPVHCIRRRSRHQELLAFRHPDLPPGLEKLIRQVCAIASNAAPSKLRRTKDEKVLHYVMTTYFMKVEDVDDISLKSQKSLMACLDPALLSLDDTPFVANSFDAAGATSLKDRMPELSGLMRSISESSIDLVDCDPAPDCSLFASWASIIVLTDDPCGQKPLLAALQARVQSSWLAAWLVQMSASSISMPESRNRISRRRLDWTAAELASLKRHAQGLVDTSQSARITNLLSCFELTSGLALEWSKAEDSLADARAYADLVAADANHRQQTAVEVLLLAFSLASFAPLFLNLPLRQSSDYLDQWRELAGLVSLLLVGVCLIAFRRR